MPQAEKRLRDKFMRGFSDGITECEDIIAKAGGKVIEGMIFLPEGLYRKDMQNVADQEVMDAVDFLLFEWDYGLGENLENS